MKKIRFIVGDKLAGIAVHQEGLKVPGFLADKATLFAKMVERPDLTEAISKVIEDASDNLFTVAMWDESLNEFVCNESRLIDFIVHDGKKAHINDITPLLDHLKAMQAA